jgi:hypothetical protein
MIALAKFYKKKYLDIKKHSVYLRVHKLKKNAYEVKNY